MSIQSKNIYFFTTLMTTLLFFPMTAYAYIDPGAGSLILQLVGVGFIALGGIWAAFKHRIKFFFNKKKGTAKPKENAGQDHEETSK